MRIRHPSLSIVHEFWRLQGIFVDYYYFSRLDEFSRFAIPTGVLVEHF